MSVLAKDISFSFRLLRKRPVDTVFAVAALGLGVGLSTAMFSILWGTVLRGLPFPEADRLVRVESISQGDRIPPSEADFLAWRLAQRSFEGVGAWLGNSFNLSGGGQPAERCNGAFVSANMFRLIQVHPLLGRDFHNADEAPNAPLVAILSAGLWKKRFNRDPNTLGTLINLNGLQGQVVGVMPEGFGFPLHQEIWVPLQLNREPIPQGQTRRVQVFAKLKKGVSRRQAEAELQVTAAPQPPKGTANGVIVTPFVKAYTEDLQPTLYLLFGASLGLLLVVCANVSGLLTAQTAARLPELAVRSALGATRMRLLTQLMAETAILTLAGTVLGMPLAATAIRAYLTSQGGELRSFWMDVRLDPPVLAYTLATTICVSFLSTVIPALQASGSRLSDVLKWRAGKGAVKPPGAISRIRLVVQFALSFALLVCTGLLIASFDNMGRLDFGRAPDRVLTAQLLVPSTTYSTPGEQLQFFHALEERLEETLGPGTAAFASALPGNTVDASEVEIEGQPVPPGALRPKVPHLIVSRHYFRVIHISAIQGRVLDASDHAEGQPAAVVNRSFVRRYLGDRLPLGSRIRFGLPPRQGRWWTIVGVIPDLVMGQGSDLHPEGVYLPLEQAPLGWMAVLLRTPLHPLSFTKALKRSVAALDPEIPVFWPATLQERMEDARLSLKTMSQVFLSFGAAALFLSLLGVYGVTAQTTASRSREMAIRLSLGGKRRDLFRLVLSKVFLQVVAGIMLGTLLSLVTVRFLAALFFHVQALAPSVFVLVSILMIIAGFVACMLPAATVLRVQPAEVCRE